MFDWDQNKLTLQRCIVGDLKHMNQVLQKQQSSLYTS